MGRPSGRGVPHDRGFPQRALVPIDAEGIVRGSPQAASPAELAPLQTLLEGVAAVARAGPGG